MQGFSCFFDFCFVVPTGRVWLLRSFWQSIQVKLSAVVYVEIEARVPFLVNVVQHVVHLSNPFFFLLPCMKFASIGPVRSSAGVTADLDIQRISTPGPDPLADLDSPVQIC